MWWLKVCNQCFGVLMVFVSKQNYGAGTTARFSLSDPKSHRIGATAWAISADHHPLSGIFLPLLSNGELLGKHASPLTWRDLGVWFGKHRELKHATLDRIYPIITLCPIDIYTYIVQKPSHATWHRRGFWYQMIGTCSLSSRVARPESLCERWGAWNLCPIGPGLFN